MQNAIDIKPQRARGRGRLKTKPLDGRTRLATFYQEGCAKIRIPESFDGRMEAVLINSSGGLTGGDRLGWAFEAGPDTHLTLTTQACEKIYKAAADTAEVTTTITVGAGAVLHWLPQESILFDQASLTRRLDVDLAENAEFLAVEAILLGRTARGESVINGMVRDRWRIRREGRLIHAEDLALPGQEVGPVAELAAAPAVLKGHAAFATLIYVGAKAEAWLEPLRRLTGQGDVGISQWNGKLVARLAAADGFALRKLLVPMLSVLRDGGAVPKVWHI
ncbi:urease accessory protein UreD [Rhizobium paknamense]|uniref:Urease accessory protein UreD n=1 Tax=Rhizobium paknamense TaxID=1206817 RepID=A0ABU0IIW9_9HYPH|nr:urease accessory protein UreD [Rhizobium paknamense]MDQ0457149.1 urease accessory protein [Rhizobium paknamense]